MKNKEESLSEKISCKGSKIEHIHTPDVKQAVKKLKWMIVNQEISIAERNRINEEIDKIFGDKLI